MRLRIVLFACQLILVGCKSKESLNENPKESQQPSILKVIHPISIDNFLLGKGLCYYARANEFKKVEVKLNSWGSEDSISQNFFIKGAKLRIVQPCRSDYKPDSIRSYFYNGKMLEVHPLMIDSLNYNYKELTFDYEGMTEVLQKDNFVLLRNQPLGWCGLANKFRFIQLFDLEKLICYEFMVNYYSCIGVRL